MYIMRLDDASEYMDIDNWSKIESVFDKYSIKPIVGVIPHNEDLTMVNRYNKDHTFWTKVKQWEQKGWAIALHGYNHVYTTTDSGLNPVNFKSEFAGVELEIQKIKIRNGLAIFKEHHLFPKIFFAPSHTYDQNTLLALQAESNIRIISDTVANDVYKIGEFYFIPQQSGRVRSLPFKITTFCYHPNGMTAKEFTALERFLSSHKHQFVDFTVLPLPNRPKSLYDQFLSWAYFSLRKIYRKK